MLNFLASALERLGDRVFLKVAAVVMLVASVSPALGQSGLRESLERLDVNQNGSIDPDEITSLSRPYLERITQARRMPMDRPMPIDKLQEAARVYYALKNGVAGTSVEAEYKSTVQPFGADAEKPMVAEFGLAEVKYPYTQEDLAQADQTLGRYDRNKDGYLDRVEAAKAKWTHRNPFDADVNEDNRLSRMELTQRYARRRLMAGVTSELVKKAVRTGTDVKPSAKSTRNRSSSDWWQQGGTSHWLTASIISRFDANRNGRLEYQEAQQLGFPMTLVDLDRDGEVSRDELHALLTEMQEEAGDLTEGLPGWFYELDADNDGQVAMHEFETDWTIARHEQFAALDINGDGLLTASEVLKSKSVVGGTYRNENSEILAPHRTVISEIEVEDDFVIDDLNLQLSITHSQTGFLDGYLTGPGGERIELFTEVGGSGNHFDQTVFDDQASTSISKGKAPFEETYRPEAMDKGQPGLAAFNGTRTKGIWQLVIRGTRSERFGMLHNWGLTVVPAEEIPDVPESEVVEEVSASDGLPETLETDVKTESSDTDSKPAEKPNEGFQLPFRLF